MHPNQQPEIIFEDAHLLVLSKPAGMLSQGDHSGTGSLVDWLRSYFGRNYVGLIHRLDRNTSGIMVVAKRTKAASRLTASLQKGDIKRTYWAWLEGDLKQSNQIWKHYLAKNSKTNEVSVVKSNHPQAQEAILKVLPLVHVLFKNQTLTLAEFVLETGRSRQIRVQAMAEGYPIAGDPKYGKPNKFLSAIFERPALHSREIVFPHPMSGEIMKYQAELPLDFKKAASLFQKSGKSSD